ncbi:MAG: diaminopimelate epimerase [Clostridia bacterium]
MEFIKMQGIGNDFVLLYGIQESALDWSSLAVSLCSRHFGIGADGLIFAETSEIADVKMRIFNSDGSEAEMCGNGIRCFAKLLFEQGIVKKNQMQVETLAGIIKPEILCEEGKIVKVKVDMGEPILSGLAIPTIFTEDKIVSKEIEAEDGTFKFTAVSMGNPHAVVFVEELKDFPLQKYGRVIENHAFFPRKTNVHFVQKNNAKELTMKTWERGAGETLACGTGACATVIAACLNGLTEREVLVHLPGGDLQINWNEQSNHVYMTGSAEISFTGTVLV